LYENRGRVGALHSLSAIAEGLRVSNRVVDGEHRPARGLDVHAAELDVPGRAAANAPLGAAVAHAQENRVRADRGHVGQVQVHVALEMDRAGEPLALGHEHAPTVCLGAGGDRPGNRLGTLLLAAGLGAVAAYVEAAVGEARPLELRHVEQWLERSDLLRRIKSGLARRPDGREAVRPQLGPSGGSAGRQPPRRTKPRRQGATGL